ncbi:MAG: histidinol-phosphatase HisJ family protein [Lachnospiraceae bacterium]|nr:histidinol-phosphatase HisJ family protein [Lachnospiraceae bacterium]
MVSSDFHIHTSFSGDSDTPMKNMIEKGIMSGLQIMCFTEHMDLDYDSQCEENFQLDTDKYLQSYLNYKEQYKDKIDLRFGVELGLQPHLAQTHQEYLADFPFDFVIGSSHLVHGIDPYYPKYFQGRQEDDCIKEYFESILENLKAFSGFDVYGHIDYIIRYCPSQKKDYSFEKNFDIIDEILKTIIALGKGIEINTGGFKYGLAHPNPHEDILKRYRELGGEIITMGSDAHVCDYLGFQFSKAAEILQQTGFRYYTVFKNRIPKFLPLK